MRTGNVQLLRVIARLNVGGPSIQAITLTKELESLGYRTTLVRGREGEREGNMDHLASELGVRPVRVDSLRRDPSWRDLLALFALVRIIRRERPRLVHTHAAKAGTIGRVATLLAYPSRRRRPVLVHTYHGHSLSGYFGTRKQAIYRGIERHLGKRTDRLIAVSEQVRDELVGFGVASKNRFEVVPLGFDLERFAVEGEQRVRGRRGLRDELGIAHDDILITLIARLVPIKRVDRFLHAAALLGDLPGAHFLVVGDGELRDQLLGSPEALALAGRLTWAGFRRDVPQICFASDLVVLCSDNEGTPVSLIEAAAAGVPTVSTRVGGAAKVVLEGETGRIVEVDAGPALAGAIRALVQDPALRARMAHAARIHAFQTFSLDRLVSDLDRLYRTLLAGR